MVENKQPGERLFCNYDIADADGKTTTNSQVLAKKDALLEKLNERIQYKKDGNYPCFGKKKRFLQMFFSTSSGGTNFGVVSQYRYQPL